MNLKNPAYKSLVDFYLFGEMERDTPNGDITTELILQGKSKAISANISSKEAGIIAGKYELDYFLKALKININWHVDDGEPVERDTKILELHGDATTILKAERPLLNFLGRLSGIATITSSCVKKVPKNVLVCPTRKTLWGLLDKKAVSLGGGGTHRLNLSSAFLAKENHLSLIKNRNITELKNIFPQRDEEAFGRFCEIEVENEKEALEAVMVLSSLKKTQGVIMFDNFSAQSIKKVLPRVREICPKVLFEASGGITLENIGEFGESGVDILSLGILTHSAKNLDLSLRVE
ncbi:carboxylating nicotinate-nucleotide diphosphorylase [Candidatus Peregrinibacteria bacterium]|nr:carboxylating nicotinate-nucleotide diphosphorylase [Candidatus Peregrinibacteria bacterium]